MLYKLTSSGDLTVSKPNGKLNYIAKVELNRWMSQNVIMNNNEINRLAQMKAEELRKRKKNVKSPIKK